MDVEAELEAKTQELAELLHDYEELGRTFNELQDELEQVRIQDHSNP
jgi:hypothetical protein